MGDSLLPKTPSRYKAEYMLWRKEDQEVQEPPLLPPGLVSQHLPKTGAEVEEKEQPVHTHTIILHKQQAMAVYHREKTEHGKECLRHNIGRKELLEAETEHKVRVVQKWRSLGSQVH